MTPQEPSTTFILHCERCDGDNRGEASVVRTAKQIVHLTEDGTGIVYFIDCDAEEPHRTPIDPAYLAHNPEVNTIVDSLRDQIRRLNAPPETVSA